jgi:CheY-like chemotaxis protein
VPQNITPVSRRVLIVDDNRDSADTAGLLLTALGCQVRTAYTGQAALREAEAFRPEMVLLDLSMPAMDGYETCRRIRAHDWGQAIFIVALSGWDRKEDRDRSARAGFDRHLTKPVDPDELSDVVMTAAGGPDKPE